MRAQDAIVVGGGLIGLAAAAALGSAGLRVALLDRRAKAALADADFDGRTTAVAFASRRMLDAIDAWRHVGDAAEPIRAIEVREGFSPRSVRYGGLPSGEPMGHIVPNGDLRRSLLAAAEACPGVTIEAPATITGIRRERDAAHVDLADGRSLSASLVVAADGKFSGTRRDAGIKTLHWRYGQTGLVCTLGHERPHGGLAVERFFPDGPCAVLPMTGNRVSIVWALDDAKASGVVRLPDESFVRVLADRVGEGLGALHLAGPRYHFPLSLVHARALTASRLALVGDAARGIHPIAGQGWNVGLRDVAALAEVVSDAVRRGRDPGGPAVLARYARWRRFDSLALVAVTDGLTRLFSNDVMPLRLARDLGLGMVERIAPLKRIFMFHAMGELGDLPPLLRGMPLRPVA
ncbi:UbiH/UbiF/VisC/COQ6 family ubiquinone biosynthesis hydroxylase [Marinivivus vitaminiproducens]|uniref:UbiH/UbiF/VisC/COQ6 family ubiquinone biosynthesis hydroxylase n=1 Tax=Marinivivus vitaminiproducens TaxID=3035935 RepID=UPI0027993B2D|nr:UbiH/UbiF/VisC/COQ6 family ubiquinone biosynthesis hydroxylase [Geminicoccaceae bacterium SCSIO 64248]